MASRLPRVLRSTTRHRRSKRPAYLLAITRLRILPLQTVDKCRGFSVEAVQTIGLFVNKGVVLRDELPADFGRIDGGRAVGGHDDGAVALFSKSLGYKTSYAHRKDKETVRGECASGPRRQVESKDSKLPDAH